MSFSHGICVDLCGHLANVSWLSGYDMMDAITLIFI